MPHPDEQDLDEEEENDDMDYEPEDDGSDDNEVMGDHPEDNNQNEPVAPAQPDRMLLLLRTLLDAGHVGNLLSNSGDASDVMAYLQGRRRQRTPKDPGRFPKVPSEEGTLLMQSGVFGANGDDAEWGLRDSSRRLIDRELGIGGLAARRQNQRIIAQNMIPTSRAESIIHHESPVYGGQFSDDGSFFYSFSQDFKVRLYDTSNPFNWTHYKTVQYPWASWSITDASLSPDNKWLAYTSLTSLVCLIPTDPNDRGDPYNLELGHPSYRGGCGLFSVRFSGDGRELVAGSNAKSIIVYDIESRTALHHIRGHDDDVNAVCFADKASPHILYSGSDDCIIKIWDRRSMGDNRAAGAFVGHGEGVTYIDSKGDGRYVLSNGKDQSMKLWDLRKAMSTENLGGLARSHRPGFHQFDYKMGRYDENNWDPHPDDNSTVTFRGHRVLRTLIRCHFSPPSSTDSRYVYSGSQDGKVYIWNMDATLAGVVDVQAATVNQRSSPLNSEYQLYWTMHDDPDRWSTCVRDVSWHPTASVLVASAWNGPRLSAGTCSIHTFNESGEDEDESGEAVSDMGRNVTETLEPIPQTAA